MRPIGFSAIAVLVALSAPAAAAPETFTINKPHSMVIFAIDRLGLTKVWGSFTKMDGEFTVDRDNPTVSTATLIIDPASVYTGFEARDKHLRSPDFFNVQEFPQIKFVTTKVERTGDKTAKVTGDLTLLGVTKPITLDVIFNGIKENASNKKNVAGFSAHGTFKRSEFGMKYQVGPISDDIAINIELLGDTK